MSQASLIIGNVSRAIYRALSNDRAAALASFQAGNAAPANPVAGMFWLDTSTAPATLKQRNVANNAWGPPMLQFATTETPDNDTTLPLNKAVAASVFGAGLPAFAHGDPGATRLFLGALERLEAGNDIRIRKDAEFIVNSGSSENNRLIFGLLQGGTLRVSIDLRRKGGVSSYNMQLIVRRVRAGVTSDVTTLQTNQSAFITLTADISVLPGDEIRLVQETVGGADCYARNLRVMTNGQDLWPGPTGGLVENNRVPS